MPQTLLGLLALAILTQLTFSQQQVTIKSYQTQVRNELSVAASGMLMEVMELMAARPFDAQSVPRVVFERGIPDESHFTSIGPGGGDTGCDPFVIDLDVCNDLDDLDTDGYPNNFTNSDVGWWPAEVELSNGHTLPFEVKIDVSYVDGVNPDVDVNTPTRNKRVVLSVRTSLLPNEGAFIHIERVIAYDPYKAAADCVQFFGEDILNTGTLAACSNPRGELLNL